MDRPNSQAVPLKEIARPPWKPGELLVAAILMFAACAWPLFHMTDDWLLHTRGVLARSSDCRLVYRHDGSKSGWYDLIVDYTTADGSMRHDSESLVLWPLNPDQAQPCEVRYSPTSPWRYRTNWGFDRMASRIVFFLVLEGWMLVLAIALPFVAARRWWRGRVRRGD